MELPNRGTAGEGLPLLYMTIEPCLGKTAGPKGYTPARAAWSHARFTALHSATWRRLFRHAVRHYGRNSPKQSSFDLLSREFHTVTQPTHAAPRRQARFVAHRVIPPDGCEPNRWYDICEGRRREDNRPGTVVLDVGTHRVPVPETCVEIRAGMEAQPAADVRDGRRRWPRRVALAMSLPLGLVAVAAVRLIAADLR